MESNQQRTGKQGGQRKSQANKQGRKTEERPSPYPPLQDKEDED